MPYAPQPGTVALSGQAASAEARQKAVFMAGNGQGVSQGELVRLQHPADQEQGEYYLIQQGIRLRRLRSTARAMPTNIRGSLRPIAKSCETPS